MRRWGVRIKQVDSDAVAVAALKTVEIYDRETGEIIENCDNVTLTFRADDVIRVNADFFVTKIEVL